LASLNLRHMRIKSAALKKTEKVLLVSLID